jgi:nitrogen regulatory protein PII 1
VVAPVPRTEDRASNVHFWTFESHSYFRVLQSQTDLPDWRRQSASSGRIISPQYSNNARKVSDLVELGLRIPATPDCSSETIVSFGKPIAFLKCNSSRLFTKLAALTRKRGERHIMKMIRAILRPESVECVADGLADAGFVSMTQVHVFGRGKQKGITVGSVHYEELPKTLLMMVVADDKVDKVLSLIRDKAHTGNFGDGMVFISPVDDAYTVRTGARGL